MKRLVVLGGHGRIRSYLEAYAESKGIEIKFFERPKPKLKEALKEADLVIVLTGIVAHEMVSLAKTYACERCLFCPQKGLCTLKRLIEKFLNNN